jgi:hypothetical protein
MEIQSVGDVRCALPHGASMDERPGAGVGCAPMSDQPDDGAKAPRSIPAGPTMQIDALRDADAILEDNAAELTGDDVMDAAASSAGDTRAPAAPPPLPRRGPPKSVVIAALVVVLAVAVGAAFFLSGVLAPPHDHVAAPAPAPALPAAATPPPAAPEPAPAEPPAPARTKISIEAIEIVGGSEENTVP